MDNFLNYLCVCVCVCEQREKNENAADEINFFHNFIIFSFSDYLNHTGRKFWGEKQFLLNERSLILTQDR